MTQSDPEVDQFHSSFLWTTSLESVSKEPGDLVQVITIGSIRISHILTKRSGILRVDRFEWINLT